MELSAIANLVNEMTQTPESTNGKYSAVVSRVDDEGTVWVHLAGSEMETPTAVSSSEISAGDAVTVEWRNNKLYIAGNITNPSAGIATVRPSVNYVNDLIEQDITVNSINAATGYIGDLTADHITAGDISASSGYIKELQADSITAQDIVSDHATVGSLDSNYAHITNGTIDNAKIGYADVNDLNAHYAGIDLANVNNAWIQNGVVKDAAITDAQIVGVSANKLTAGTIDASDITVTNLNASNITTGSITVDGITIDVENNEASIDGGYIEDGTITLNGFAQEVKDVIDGAIETFTGTVVPTLNNQPAKSWNTTKLKDQHIGDVYYVVNASSQQNGYCYRFSKSGSTYSWQLIKDSDVTAALQRLQTAEGKIGNIETFDEQMATFKTETEGDISTLQTKTTSLETSLGDKVDTSTFNTLSQTVDGNSATITTLTTTTQTLRNDLDGLEIGGRNYFVCYDNPLADDKSINHVTYDYNASNGEYTLTVTETGNFFCQIVARVGVSNLSDILGKTVTLSAQSITSSNANANPKVYFYGTKEGDTWSKGIDSENLTNTFEVPTDLVKAGYLIRCDQNKADVVGDVATFTGIKLEKGNKATDWSPAPEDMATAESVTTVSNTVNVVSQTATSNSSKISSLTTTLGTNADGTTKTGDVMHRTSAVEQDLSGFKTTVSETYATKTALTQAETDIEQNAEAISLRATKTEASQMAQPNLSPFLQNTPYTTATGYWRVITTDRYTPLADGWAHLSCDNTSGAELMHNYLRMASCPSVIDGGTYTVLVEIRNLNNTATSSSIYSQQSTLAQIWGSSEGFSIANSSMENGSYYKSVTALGVSQHNTDGTILMSITWGVPAGAKVDADIRISMYEGDYSGPYKPYSGDQLYASKSELKVANDAISLKVSKDSVIAEINASTETSGGSAVKISANKVNIEGAAIFTSGRLSESSLNNAYDANGAAAAVAETIPTDVSDLNNDSGFITSADVPTKVSDLTNDSGYQTASDVSTAVGGKADKTAAVAETQRIYYRSSSSTKPNGNGLPTTWVTETGNKYNSNATTSTGWSRKVTPIASGTGASVTKYPYLWTCIQKKTVSGTVTYGDILLDDATTVIDGGTIVTGTVNANAVNASSGTFDTANIPILNASKIDTGSITVGSLSDGSSYSTTNQMNYAISTAVNDVQIGGRNYFVKYDNPIVTDRTTADVTYEYDASNGEYELTVTDTSQSYRQLFARVGVSNLSDILGKTVTLSAQSITSSNANAAPKVYFYGTKEGGSWSKSIDSENLTNTFEVPTDLVKVGYIIRCDQNKADVVGDVATFTGIKLEKGNKATDWTPAPEDVEADTVEYIVGTQTGATNLWTGVSKSTSLYAGKTIAYYLPFAGNSTAATLNLTLADGTATGAKNIRRNNSTVTTQFPQYSVITMTYDGSTWRITGMGSDTNYYDRTAYKASVTATAAISSARIGVFNTSGNLILLSTTAFDVTKPILYIGTAYTASALTQTNNYTFWGSAFKLTNTHAITGAAAGKPVYIVGTLNGTTLTPTSAVLTCTVPTRADGYAYLRLGLMSTATDAVLESYHPIYMYYDGKFQPCEPSTTTAAKTATSYITKIDDDGIRVHPSSTTDNSVLINADGMEVFKGGTGATNSIAKFGTNSSSNTETFTKVLYEVTALGDDVTVPELATADNGSTITVTTRRRNLESGGVGILVLTFTKGTSGTSYAIGYDGNSTFSNGNTDWEFTFLKVEYTATATPKIIRLGNTTTNKSGILFGNSNSNGNLDSFSVSLNGDINTLGSLYSANVGFTNVMGTTGSISKDVSTTSGTWTPLMNFSLIEGVYMAIADISFNANANGCRMANISATSAQNWQYVTQGATPGSSAKTSLTVPIILHPTETTTYYVNAYQNSGGSLNATVELYYVRIR